MWIVGALERSPRQRSVLCLHETVAAGAADAYARMLGQPAAALLHLGPGLANSLAALHNAKRAGAPVIVLIGEMSTWHQGCGAPLEMDIETLAGTVAAHVRTTTAAAAVEGDAFDAVASTLRKDAPPGASRVAAIILPHDVQWSRLPPPPPAAAAALSQRLLAATSGPNGTAAAPLPPPAAAAAAAFVRDCAAALRSASRGKVAVLLGGRALLSGAGGGGALEQAGRVAAHLGAALLCVNNFARADRGRGRPALARLPYFPQEARKEMSKYDVVVLADCSMPAPMFGYEACGSLQPICGQGEERIWELDSGDPAAALRQLADALGAPPWPLPSASAAPSAAAGGTNGANGGSGGGGGGAGGAAAKGAKLTASAMCAVVASLQPPDAIVVDESLTSGTDYWAFSAAAPPFSHLALTGGAIGQGPPAAVGAAVACPGRRVINLQADGSGLYSPQALWTQARERLDVVTVVCANSAYNILKLEIAIQRVGTGGGAVTRSLTSLDEPRIDWVKLSEGMGVPATRAATAEELRAQMAAALARPGPSLIEAVLA